MRKFSTSSFRWIYMFWNVLKTIWPFLENVCRSVGTFVSKICEHCISRANARKVTTLYIQLHLYKNCCWLDIDGNRPIGGAAMLHFSQIFWHLKYLISLGVLHGNKPNSGKTILIRKKLFVKFLCTSISRARCCCIFSSNLVVLLTLYISKSFA